jgi:hypothetical protein
MVVPEDKHMPTVAERLEQVQLKVKRAKEHIEEVQAEVSRFLDGTPYGVGAKHDPQTGKLIYYVSSVKPAPKRLPLVAGDAIQCLMSALDHLAYQVVCSDTADNPPNPNWIYFPIRDSAQDYEAKKRGKMEGAAQETFDAIDALKPYKGGNDALWSLFRLNNIEKHRTLLTVGSFVATLDIGQIGARHLFEAFNDWPEGIEQLFDTMHAHFRPTDSGFPLKVGYELLIGAVNEKPNPNAQFTFGVALAEPGVLESQSLIETLHQLSALVEGIVTALTPRLRDTP